MKKMFSLIKASMSEGMNIFKVSTKNKNNFTKIALPIILTVIIMLAIYSYCEQIITQLKAVNMEFVLLTLFILLTSLLTLTEGIYKSGNLLFNCKDDNLLLSLPIKKGTVLFVRILKFYLFELAYNSLFIIPAIASYAMHVKPGVIYYIVSAIGLLLFPIIPILLSCFIGTFITYIASKFKGKNIIQTVLTVILLLGIMYLSFNTEKIIADISSNASSINDVITKLYYPAGAYIELITNFSSIKLCEFITINIGLFAVTIILIGKIYYNINSSSKSIKINKTNKQYVIKTSNPIRAMVKKEFNRFINSTVFITNAGFGLVLYIIACILLITRFDNLANKFTEISQEITTEYLKNCISIILFALICFSSFMTSITSSMISLEGKSINLLKSLPIKPYTIIKSKVLAAVLIMIPCILIGDIMVFIKFKFDILSVILILVASVILPLLSETIGIMVNLKYPRMDAKNDTEVVKQSMSSSMSVFIGMGLLALTGFLLFKALEANIAYNIIILMFLAAFSVIYTVLLIVLNKTCDKSFEDIT